MIDVFLCTCASDPIRSGLLQAVQGRWLLEPDVNVWLLTPDVVGCSNRAFQGLRRKWAEEHSREEVYILAEDDCMPLGTEFVKRGLATLDRHPDYAVLSPLLLPFPPPHGEEEVSEGITAGGINFTRRGKIDVSLIPSDGTIWDESAQAQHLRLNGWRSGWMTKVLQNHLGAFHSTIWPTDYTGTTSVNDA